MKRMNFQKKPVQTVPKSKRGLAIELAISVLLLLSSLCLLFVTFTLATRKIVNDGISGFEEQAAVDQIGEDFAAAYAAWISGEKSGAFAFSHARDDAGFGAYIVRGDEDAYTLRVTKDSNENTVLTVTLAPEGDGYRVLEWARSARPVS